MIRINLVPQDEARRIAARKREKQVGVLVTLALVVVIATAEFFTRRDAAEIQAEADVYKAQLAELTKKYQENVLLERKQKALESKLKTIDVLERQTRGPVRVLADLGEATPEKLWLTEMRETGGAAVLSGRGLDNQTVALFMRNLEDSPYFSNVELVETKQVEDGKAKLKQFAIRSSVLYAGRRPQVEEPAEDENAKEEKKTARSTEGGAGREQAS